MIRRHVYTIVVMGLMLHFSGYLPAQDVQPRVYAPAPVGVNLLTVGYAYSSGSLLFDKTVPVENVRAHIHSFNAAYSRSTSFLGKAGRFDAALPFVMGNWEGEIMEKTQTTSRTGIGDPVLRYAIFITGAPALDRKECAEFEPKTIVGLTMRIQVPLGQYDPNKLVNLGSNRWVFSPQVGVWHAVRNFTFEAYAGLWIFTNNNEFLGSQVRSQSTLATFQLHVSYEFQNGIWIAISSRQSLGGVVTVDNGGRLDPETNNRIGLTVAAPIKPKYTLKVIGTTGVTTTVGNDYDTIGLAWQMAF